MVQLGPIGLSIRILLYILIFRFLLNSQSLTCTIGVRDRVTYLKPGFCPRQEGEITTRNMLDSNSSYSRGLLCLEISDPVNELDIVILKIEITSVLSLCKK